MNHLAMVAFLIIPFLAVALVCFLCVLLYCQCEDMREVADKLIDVADSYAQAKQPVNAKNKD